MPSAVQNTADLTPKVAQNAHPVYKLLQTTWQKLADVREGTGGFLDGTYIQAHPREWLDHTALVTETDPVSKQTRTVARTNPNPKQPSPKLLARRRIARYENVASAILSATRSVLFREQPTRRVGDGKGTTPTPIEQWWQDVDGKELHIDDAMPIWWDLAATFGHMGLYFYQPMNGEATTAADEPTPYLRVYTPLDILNWLTDEDGNIVSVKLMEAVAPTGFDQTLPTYRVRVIDATAVTVYDFKSGKRAERYEHGLGRMPFVFLFAKRRPMLSDVGESVLGDPRNYIDLYNLTSEVRELLRNQTFSLINLPLGTGPDAPSVEQAQTMMGKQTGTMNVLFSALPAQILTGDSGNVAAYHDEIERVRREIYRETGVQWEADSKDAEAKGSLQLKREEMTTRIALYADECQHAEYTLIELFYRWKDGPDNWEAALETDQVTVQYPDRFQQEPFADVLNQALSAQSLGMPALVLKAIRKQVLRKFDGMANLPPNELKALDEAIDNAPDDPTPADRLRSKIQGMAGGGSEGDVKPPPVRPVAGGTP